MSNIARVYQPGTEPWLFAGSAASNAAGAGTPEVPGHEKAYERANGKELALGGQDLSR